MTSAIGWDEALPEFERHLRTVPGVSGQVLGSSLRNFTLLYVRQFAGAATVGPWEVDELTIERWLGGKALTRKTEVQVLAALRSFYRWGTAEGLVRRWPVPGLRPFAPGWVAAFEEFDEHLRVAPTTSGRPLSSSTRGQHVRRLGPLAQAASVGPWNLGTEELDAWLAGQSWTELYRKQVLEALRAFYAWGQRAGYSQVPPGTGLRPGWRQGSVPLGNGWDAAIDGFADSLALSGRSTETCATYLKHVGWVAESVSVGPWDLDNACLVTWLDGRNWSRETRRQVLVSLRFFYAWGISAGQLEWAPVAGIQSPANQRRGPAPLRITPRWQEPIESFLVRQRAAKKAEGTLRARSEQLRSLSLVSANPWAVTTHQLALWLSNPDWTPATARSRRSTLRQFYAWAVSEGRIETSPAADLQPVRIPRVLPRPTPDGPLGAALEAADQRTRLMLMLGALAGLRRIEIATLHTRNVTESEIFVAEGKGGHQRRVPMHPVLWDEISAELARRRRGATGTGWGNCFVTETGYLFPSDHHPGPMTPAHVGSLISRVLPPPWTTHSLRHRFATMSYAEQRDLLAVQQLLGHAKPETTAVYAQVPDGALRTAVLGVKLPSPSTDRP